MGKVLRADIVIGGRADGSLFALGGTLLSLGAQINGISSKLIDFGKESTEAYASFEDYMLDAEVALRTQYKSTGELSKAMEQLDQAGMQWASDSRFTTQDVAKGISEAAHAGWDLQRILSGMPAAIDISLAGGMDLAQGLQYLVDVSNAAGVGFEDLGQLVDYWAYAANRSSTTIPEMGEAMQKMGATMQFAKGDMAGLVTMLAVLADNGAKGTEAGTLLRNSLIRMIAPTEKAAEAMADLDLTMDELDEIYGDSEGLEEAVEALKEAGFSAYDASGKLKPLVQVWEELNDVTRDMTEEERNKTLSAIFPTRTITGALALLEAAEKDWDGLYESIRDNAEGYADYAAQTMESGLGGALRHLESVYNALQTRTGEELAGVVSSVADGLSGLVEGVNGLDNATFQGLLSGLGVIAGAGPALLTVGGGMRLIGAVIGTGLPGQLVLAGLGLTALTAGLIGYRAEAEKQEYQDHFGGLALDMDRIQDYVSSLDAGLTAAEERMERYNAAAEQAVQDYTDATGGLKTILTSTLLTGGELTSGEVRQAKSLGSQIGHSLLEAIEKSYSETELSAALFKDGAVEAGGEDLWAGILDTMEYGHETAVAEAKRLGGEIRDALSSALTDGQIDAAELLGIQDLFDEANALIADRTEAENAAEKERMLRKAQTMGLDAVDEMADLVAEQRDSALANLEEAYIQGYKELYAGGLAKIRAGALNADGTPYTMENLKAELDAYERGNAAQQIAQRADGDKTLLWLFEHAAMESDLSNAWTALKEMAGKSLDGTVSELDKVRFQSLLGEDAVDLAQYTREMVDAFGGAAELRKLIGDYAESGDMETANDLNRLLAMNSLAAMAANENIRMPFDSPGAEEGYQVAPYLKQGLSVLGNAFSNVLANTAPTDFVSLEGASSGGDYVARVVPEIDPAGLAQLGNTTVPVSLVPSGDSMGLESLEGKEVRVSVDGDTGPLAAAIQEQNGKRVETFVDGDASALGAAISAYDGQVVTVTVAYNSTGGPSLGGGTVSADGAGPSVGGGLFAEGGRATTASIFGEAGPEWAIPEAHTERTAMLLDAAREASGFTWPELLGRNGGLNGGQKRNWTLVYRPTIVAANADGVERKLMEDKERLEKWLRDKKLLDELEVYA